MYFIFYTWDNANGSTVVKGIVSASPTEGGKAKVDWIDPPEFKKYLDQQIYGKFDSWLQLVSDKHEFDPDLMIHWEQLPLMRRFNGQSGVVMVETEEEFSTYLTEVLHDGEEDETN